MVRTQQALGSILPLLSLFCEPCQTRPADEERSALTRPPVPHGLTLMPRTFPGSRSPGSRPACVPRDQLLTPTPPPRGAGSPPGPGGVTPPPPVPQFPHQAEGANGTSPATGSLCTNAFSPHVCQSVSQAFNCRCGHDPGWQPLKAFRPVRLGEKSPPGSSFSTRCQLPREHRGRKAVYVTSFRDGSCTRPAPRLLASFQGQLYAHFSDEINEAKRSGYGEATAITAKETCPRGAHQAPCSPSPKQAEGGLKDTNEGRLGGSVS